jgi:hypothetical protein
LNRYGSEAISKGGRSETVESPDHMLNFTLDNPLVKDLHETSPDNRDFLQARFQAEESDGAALNKYRRKIAEQFFPARGDGKLNDSSNFPILCCRTPNKERRGSELRAIRLYFLYCRIFLSVSATIFAYLCGSSVPHF